MRLYNVLAVEPLYDRELCSSDDEALPELFGESNRTVLPANNRVKDKYERLR